MPYKKAGMHERKYKSHTSENIFGHGSDQESIKEGLGGSLGNRNSAVKQFHKSEKKWKRELKSLKKQKKMLYIMENIYRTHREMKKIKNI